MGEHHEGRKRRDRHAASRRRPGFDSLEGRALLSTYGLDPTFGSEGISLLQSRGVVAKADAVAVQPDGKILVAGSTADAGPAPDFSVKRYNPDGTPDASFTPAQVAFGQGGTDDQVRAIAVAPDGTIVLAGSAQKADGSTFLAVARLNADGTPHAGFGNGGKLTISVNMATNESAFFVAALPNNQFLVVGSDTTTSAPDQHAVHLDIARLNADGTLDGTFGTNSKTSLTFGYFDTDPLHQDTQSVYEFTSATIAQDGKLVVAGDIHYVGPQIAQPTYTPVALRIGTDGNLDPTFGSNGLSTLYYLDSALISDRARGVATQPDGSVVLGVAPVNPANPSGIGPSNIFAATRLTPTGALDKTFGGSGVATVSFPGATNASVAAVAVLPDGRIALAGQVANFTPNAPYLDAGLAILTPGGQPDPTFGNMGQAGTSNYDYFNGADIAGADGIAVAPGGTLVVAGLAETAGSSGFTGHPNAVGLARINTAQSVADSAFITSLFQTYLHRAPTASELAGRLQEYQYYAGLGNFQSQGGRGILAREISRTGEAEGDLVNGLFLTYLRRAADPGAISGFTQYLQGGGTQQGLTAIILASGEYYTLKGGSDTGFVTGLYQDLLGRGPARGDIQFWTSQVAANGRASVANAFLSSQEFRYDTIAGFYHPPANTALPVILRRPNPPLYGEVVGWQNSTFDTPTIALIFIESVEYFVNG